MDKKQILLRLVLKALGIKVDMQLFDHRLILQKAIYIAEAVGVDLGYNFNWYLRGPYSSKLADDGFLVDSAIKRGEKDEGWSLDAGSQKNLENLRGLFPKELDVPQTASKLELLASVHYLVKNLKLKEKGSLYIAKKLNEYGKPYLENQVDEALGELKKYGIN